MHLGRSNVTIVSPNAPRTLKRYYSKSKCSSANAMLNPNWAKSGSGAPAPKSAPSDTKSVTFAKGIFQASDLPKFISNPIREASFSWFSVLTCFGLRLKQIGIRCSGSRKWSQRYEIDYFCQWFCWAFRCAENLSSSSSYGATEVSLAP